MRYFIKSHLCYNNFFRNYLVSDTSVWWPDLSVDSSCVKDLVCATSKVDDQPTFSVRVRI